MTSVHPGSHRTPRLGHARVSEAMRAGVLACSPGTPLRDVGRIMAANHVHCVVVRWPPERDRPRSWGIVTDLDLTRAIAADHVEDRTAGDVAAHPATVSADDTLEHAARLMAEQGVAHLVALAPASVHPAGVLSTLDLAGIAAWGEA